MISVRVHGAKEIIKGLKNIDIKEANHEWLKVASSITVAESKIQAPVYNGTLRNRIRADIKRDHAIIYTKVPYALFVHEWTHPYTIQPKKKKSLFRKGATHPVKVVHHPGIKANPFFDRASAIVETKLQKKYINTVGRFITQAIGN